jgi:type IV pilus assembly protein PilB
MGISTDSIGNILLQLGKINQGQLDIALSRQKNDGVPLGETIIELGYATSKDIALALSIQLNIPFIELDEGFKIVPEYIKLIPEAIARKFCLIPFKKEKGVLTIIMRDPLDIEAINTVQALTNLEVHKAINTQENIVTAINKFYKEEAQIESNIQDIVDLENIKELDKIEAEGVDSEQLRVLANDVPVVRFVNLLLLQAVRDRASDIHIEPAERNVYIRIRVDGVLRNITPPPKSLYQAIITRIKILAHMNIAERRLPQDGRFKFKVGKRLIDIRVSSLPEACGEKLVLRILDRERLLMNMEDIGMEPDMLHHLKKILKKPHGIILLTGPTGSGKTTTLYSALNFLKDPGINIQTVEDPIEYLIEGINQLQVKPHIDLTFANALRSILRQDPDKIMIGEIRDVDTARIAMRAALTGHLVLSTLHTNDAISAFSRLRDIGIEQYLIAATINLVISQRLVKLICKKCKEKIAPPPDTLKLVASIYPDSRDWKYYRGKGCEECFKAGYRGQTGIFEFLEVTEPIKDMILQGARESVLINKAVQLGMTTLLTDGLNKVKNGLTTIEEVLSVCPTPNDF